MVQPFPRQDLPEKGVPTPAARGRPRQRGRRALQNQLALGFDDGEGDETGVARPLRGCLESLGKRAKMRTWDTRVTSATRNGGLSVVCFQPPSQEDDPVRQSFGRPSMPSSTSCAVVALGACSPETFPLSRRSTCTSSNGETTGHGRKSMPCFETASGVLKGARRVPVQRSWIAKA